MNEPLSISPIDLLARLGRADAPLLLDVRRQPAFAASDRMLQGAIRCAPEDVAAFAASRPPQPVVVYCVYGHNVSHDAAAELRKAGWPAWHLAGGIKGGEDGVDAEADIRQWRSTALPTVAKRPEAGA